MNRDACRWQENGHAPCYENARLLLAYEAAEGLGENSSHCCWWWGVKGGCEGGCCGVARELWRSCLDDGRVDEGRVAGACANAVNV